MEAPLPANELDRLKALRCYNVLDSPPEREFDDLTRLASRICDTPIALVSLVDEDRQWFKSRVGLEATETPRHMAFCSHTILGDHPLVVPDATLDARFRRNPLVTGDPNIRFYAGAPLRTPVTDFQLGTLCVIDTRPRELGSEQIEALESLARQVITQMELRRKVKLLAEYKIAADVANRELQHSNEELQQYAYVVSHDLQTPLRAVAGFSQLLLDDYSGKLDPVADEWITRVVDGCKRMQTMIKDLLTYSRVESRARPFAEVNLNEVVNDACDLMRLDIEESGAEVTSDDLPTVAGDQAQLAQLLHNLIGNGLKYHRDESPRVHVGAERSGPFWTITVEDNGIGVEPDQQEKIFEVFKRLHTNDKYPGTGIGLSVCRRIVKRHGGKIWLESEPGVGSKFSFDIPSSASIEQETNIAVAVGS